ncbi:MAG: patatin-like phospholipase family protein [Tepidanaerobacteraceae bacterium]|jgi:NTE family protein|nr:patatin-like phospholipase family protein [Tepidanaerobacteraceae bacterium]
MRYKIGIALSGGGVRGAVHLGVLKVLAQNGIYPDIISGTSAGSIAGAIYAAGIDIDSFVEKLKDIQAWKILDPSFTPAYVLMLIFYYWTNKPMVMWSVPDGLFKGEKIEYYLDDLLQKKKFDELCIPLSVVSADINTGETVVFCSRKNIPRKKIPNTVFIPDAKVSEAVRASISLPGVFLPKNIKGRKLVDGGIKDNIPVDILYHQRAKKVLAVDLGVTTGRGKADSMLEILMASVDIMGDELSCYIRKNYPGYYLYPDLKGVGYRDFRRIPEFVKYGEEVAYKALPEIRKFLAS